MSIWEDKFINVNQYARSGKKLTGVRKIVVHYTANPGASAQNHYKYFSNLSGRYASAHFFVDSVDALCIIPLNEVAYHANDVQKRVNGAAYRGVAELKPNANLLSVGIELCIEKDGSFHPETLEKAENVAAELCRRYKLNPLDDIVRHFDVTAKNCPAPWVASTEGFTQFKANVSAKLNGGKLPSQPAQSVAPTSTLLKLSSKGDAVKQLQENLNKLGFDCGKADGAFGELTFKAVKAFQAKFKLDVDGIVGKDTLTAITSALVELAKPKEEVKVEPKKEETPAKVEPVVEKKEEVKKEESASIDKKEEVKPVEKVMPKVTSLGDTYAFQVKAKKDIGVYKNSDLSEKQRVLKSGTIFSVYGYTTGEKAYAVPNGFVQAQDVEPIPLHLRTGGLSKVMEAEFRAFLKENKIDSTLNVVSKGNPSSDIEVAGLQLVKVKKFLNERKWWFNVK